MTRCSNAMTDDQTVDGILGQDELPAIGADADGKITFINACFEREYGWARTDIVGKPLTTIIPAPMRETHLVGFSRFMTTGQPRLLGRSLELPILCKDGEERRTRHYILAEKTGETWRLAALIRP